MLKFTYRLLIWFLMHWPCLLLMLFISCFTSLLVWHLTFHAFYHLMFISCILLTYLIHSIRKEGRQFDYIWIPLMRIRNISDSIVEDTIFSRCICFSWWLVTNAYFFTLYHNLRDEWSPYVSLSWLGAEFPTYLIGESLCFEGKPLSFYFIALLRLLHFFHYIGG